MLKFWTTAFAPLAIAAGLTLSTAADAGTILGNKGSADYGRKISQAECQAIAQRNVAPYLRNPSAAEYRWGRCTAQTMSANVFKKLPRQSGYGMEFSVNSTNKWGHYTGYTAYQILIKDGQVLRRLRQGDRGAWEKY